MGDAPPPAPLAVRSRSAPACQQPNLVFDVSDHTNIIYL